MKVAILRRGGIGDLLCTVPMIHALFEENQNLNVTLFLETRSESIAPFIQESLSPRSLNICWILPGNKYYQSLKKALFFRNQFDMAICAKTTPMKLGDRFLRVLNAPISMAVSFSKNISHPRNAEKVGHQALRCLKIFRPEIESIPEAWLPFLNTFPMKIHLPPPILFFSLSNRRASSQLEVARFASIANQLPYSILINASHPTDAAEHLKKQLQVPSQILYTPKMQDLLAALKASDLVLTGDGGLCHLAAALQIPQIALYARTPLDLWAPLGPSRCLYHPENVNSIPIEDIFLLLSHFINQK